jgi:hypothetical protein
MRNYILLILLAFSTTAGAQSYINFATGRATDTAKTTGSMLVPAIVRLPYYSSSDTNKVLGITANGTIVLRNKGSQVVVDSTIYASFYQVDTAKKKLRSQLADTAFTLVHKADSNVNKGYLAWNYWLQNRNLGTVTSITATSPLTGGTITTSGNIGLGTVPYANGGTNTTTFTSQRLIFSGVNTLKTNDSIVVDTANGYIGLGTTAPTTPIYIKRNKTIFQTNEYVGTQSGLTVASTQMKNPSGHTGLIGIQDNAPTITFKINNADYLTLNNGGFNFGTIAGAVGNQTFFNFAGNAGNSSGILKGFNLSCGGVTSGTGAFTGFLMNVTTTLTGTGPHVLMNIQRSGNDRFKIDTEGNASIVGVYAIGGTPTITAGAGAGTGPTVSMTAGSTDMAGSFTVTTGTSIPGGTSTICTITFSSTKSRIPIMIDCHPANSAAALNLNPVWTDIANVTTTKFELTGGPLGPSITYKYYYHVIQ